MVWKPLFSGHIWGILCFFMSSSSTFSYTPALTNLEKYVKYLIVSNLLHFYYANAILM